MIGRLPQAEEQPGIDASIQGGIGDDFLEEVHIHPTGTGEGHQQAAEFEKFEAKQRESRKVFGRNC